jgi:hypothetical protein
MRMGYVLTFVVSYIWSVAGSCVVDNLSMTNPEISSFAGMKKLTMAARNRLINL